MKRLIIIGIVSCAPFLIAISKANKSRIYQVSNPVSIGEKLRIIGVELQKGPQEADLGVIHSLLAGISPRYLSYVVQEEIKAAELAQNFCSVDGDQSSNDGDMSSQEVMVTAVEQDLVEEQGAACPLSLEGHAEEHDSNVEQSAFNSVEQGAIDEQKGDSLEQE